MTEAYDILHLGLYARLLQHLALHRLHDVFVSLDVSAGELPRSTVGVDAPLNQQPFAVPYDHATASDRVVAEVEIPAVGSGAGRSLPPTLHLGYQWRTAARTEVHRGYLRHGQ